MNTDTLIIQGGKLLSGKIKPQGAKNEALQILSAVLLYPGKTLVNNIPDIADVNKLIDILEYLGVTIEKVGPGEIIFDATSVDADKMDTAKFHELSSSLRGSLMVAGAMLGRFGRAFIPTPGGDKIGIRPITTHLRGFKSLGAYEVGSQNYVMSKDFDRPKRIQLREASVTGTANILLASIFLPNSHPFQIYNAACEPYVQQLCSLLEKYGAKISGVGSNLITIDPSKVNTSAGLVEHTIQPDMIEIGSLIVLAAVCGDGILIEGENLLGVLGETAQVVFEKLGTRWEERPDGLYIPRHSSYAIQAPSVKGKIRAIYDQVWPGLSPDHISHLIVLAVFAKGSVVFEQRMFDERLHFTRTLRDMGATINPSTNKQVLVVGNNRQIKLVGVEMSSPDIRAGMTLLIAALAAEGQSVIQNAHQIHRGYEKIVDRLKNLDADISYGD